MMEVGDVGAMVGKVCDCIAYRKISLCEGYDLYFGTEFTTFEKDVNFAAMWLLTDLRTKGEDVEDTEIYGQVLVMGRASENGLSDGQLTKLRERCKR